MRVTLSNHGKELAFQVHLGIGRPGEKSEILRRALWHGHNYIEVDARRVARDYGAIPEFGGAEGRRGTSRGGLEYGAAND